MGAEKRGQTGKDDRKQRGVRRADPPVPVPVPDSGISGTGTGTSSERSKTIHFVSLGCPKNRVDSEVMLGVARDAGFAHVADAGDAEVIVVNTCGFIGEAKKESIDAILEMAELKASGR